MTRLAFLSGRSNKASSLVWSPGICPILEVTGKFARLVALVVDQRVRRQGVGQALVAAAERIAVERGCILVEVTSSRTRAGAHEFYRALGYEDACGRSARFTKQLQEAAAG